MTKTAVLICPGRGTYNKEELGYLARHHSNKSDLFADFDAIRAAAGQESVTALDSAPRFSIAKHTRGDVASALIYAASLADCASVSPDIEIVAVTGNSMGWYTALAAAGALSPTAGFRVVNTMGTLMQQHLIGGQVIYPIQNDQWQIEPDQHTAMLDLVAEINARETHVLALSIDLGGMLVLAGNDHGLAAFDAAVPRMQGRFPLRLPNHAAFHTSLQAPVAQAGRKALARPLFTQPQTALIDGRGEIWWPHSSNLERLYDYTLDHQVVETFDFSRAIKTAAEAFAPDIFILAGPGTTLGGAIAQSLIRAGWQDLHSKSDFKTRQTHNPVLVSMGLSDQRQQVT